MKRRALNIRSEDAGHPFRKMLAPTVLAVGNLVEEQPKVSWWKQEDTHLFVTSFLAFFIVFYTFIA